MKDNYKKFTNNIASRSNIFYWQTDREISPEIAGKIWADRHHYFSDNELLEKINSVLDDDKLISLSPLDLQSQTSLGNVNSVRTGTLSSGKEVIIRCHPKGIKNGYFHAEATAAKLAKQHGLASYSTIAIHDYKHSDDFSFHVCEKLHGIVVKNHLEKEPKSEVEMLSKMGKTMARIHQIKVNGFGPFDNEIAKEGKLMGLHSTYAAALNASLEFNINVLKKEGIINDIQKDSIFELFSDTNTLLELSSPVLIHNDFADWNLLTDSHEITGIVDWDECVGGDPIADIACWSTFFAPERLEMFLEGYWQGSNKPANFSEKFELLRLRYIISKMTLRLRRYTWEPSASIKEKILIGHRHLSDSLKYFHIEAN